MKTAILSAMFMVVLAHLVNAQDPQKVFIEAINDFAQNLHLKLSGPSKDSNALSAFGTHSSLSMLSLGARNETFEGMDRALNLSAVSDIEIHELYRKTLSEEFKEDVEFVTAMLINTDKPIEEEFKVAAESKYLAKIETFKPSDAEPEKKINDYVSLKTDGRIREIIKKGSINEKTSVVLVSSIYFNSTWESEFDVSKTSKQEFTCENGKKIEIDMMNDSRIVLYKSDNESDVDVIQMPLKNGHSVFFALPRKVGGLQILQERLSKPGNLRKLFENLEPITVKLALPKFKTESRFELKESLKEMGMQQAFEANSADFSGISKQTRLHVTEVIHAANFEINERGPLGSAASVTVTEDSLRPRVEGPEQAKFEANHGFLYWVMNTNSRQIYLRGLFNGDKKQ